MPLPGTEPAPAKDSKRSPKVRFTPPEDIQIVELVGVYGNDDWQSIASHFSGRTARQCRERWAYYLSPSVTNGPWSPEEDALLLDKFQEFGSQWNKMRSFFQGRSHINIKNRCQTLIRRRRNASGCGTADQQSPGVSGDQPPNPDPVHQPPDHPVDLELESLWMGVEYMTSFDLC
jgi:hypothetical protein